MKRIFGTISDLILPAIIFAAVMAFLVSASFLGRIGKRMEGKTEDFSDMADTAAIGVLCEREEPQIRCVGKRVWNVGEILSIPEIFHAVDTDGGNLSVTVANIIDQNGDSVMDCYHKQKQEAVFSKKGAYTFFLMAMDKERKSGTEIVSVLVDGR